MCTYKHWSFVACECLHVCTCKLGRGCVLVIWCNYSFALNYIFFKPESPCIKKIKIEMSQWVNVLSGMMIRVQSLDFM